MIVTTLVFLLVISVLVFVHELGHFLAAKKAGIKVEEFAFGFPPKIFSKKVGETVYAINAIPIGGYVRMLGEDEESKSKRSFSQKSTLARGTVSVAGVLMNVILSWLILTIGFAVGMTPITSTPDSLPGEKTNQQIIVTGVNKGSIAEKVGLSQGDEILSISYLNEKTVFGNTSELSNYTKSHLGKGIDITFKHDNNIITQSANLPAESDAPLGISIAETAKVRTAWYMAPVVALREVAKIVQLHYEFFGTLFKNIFVHGQLSEGVGGPVAIYVYSGMAAKAGAMVVLQFIAILSISLAIMNILPFPALDGGRLLFIILERIFHKKVLKENVENMVHAIGFALILVFAAVVTYKDIINFIIKK